MSRFQEDILQDIIVLVLELIKETDVVAGAPVVPIELPSGENIDAIIEGDIADIMYALSDLSQELLEKQQDDKDVFMFEVSDKEFE